MGTLSYLLASANLAPNATLVPDSEDAVFVVENFQTLPISKPYKSAALGSPAGAVRILMDFGTAQTIDTFALVNHNLESDAVIEFRGGAASDPAALITTVTWRNNLAWDVITPSVSHRHWSLTLTDSDNADSLFRIGYLIMGLKVDLSVNQFHQWSKPAVKKIREGINEIGLPLVGAKLYEGTQTTLSFKGLTAAELVEIDTWLDALDVKTNPLLLIPELTEAHAYFSRLQDPHVVDISNGKNYIEEVTFQTDNFGTIITA